jgi:hypothetical protein
MAKVRKSPNAAFVLSGGNEGHWPSGQYRPVTEATSLRAWRSPGSSTPLQPTSRRPRTDKLQTAISWGHLKCHCGIFCPDRELGGGYGAVPESFKRRLGGGDQEDLGSTWGEAFPMAPGG